MNVYRRHTNQRIFYFFLISIVLWLAPFSRCYGQLFEFKDQRTRDAIDFEMIKDLVVIPVMINNKGPYNFILDSGVGPTIITDTLLRNSLDLNNLLKITENGLGNGEEISAKMTSRLEAQVGEAYITNMPTIFIDNDPFNLSAFLGKDIVGLIGYSFFNSFFVNVNYENKRLVYSTSAKKIRFKSDKIPIEIIDYKPYLTATVETDSGGKIAAKLVIDCGASHALSLEKLNGNNWPFPAKNINGNLGVGINGEISGKIARSPALLIGHHRFKDVLTNFPDLSASVQANYTKDRNGNLGANILMRFNVFFDYKNGFLYLKKNGYYNLPFEHDMAGVEIFVKHGAFFISRIEEGSAAEKAGLLPSDQIIGINFKNINNYSLNEVINLLKSKDGYAVLVEVVRKDETMIKLVKLKKRI